MLKIGSDIKQLKKSARTEKIPRSRSAAYVCLSDDTVTQIRFAGCELDVYLVVCKSFDLFEGNVYYPCEIIYYDRGRNYIMYRRAFFAQANQITIKYPQLGDDAIKEMGLTFSNSRPAVDVVWDGEMASLEGVKDHFAERFRDFAERFPQQYEKSCRQAYLNGAAIGI